MPQKKNAHCASLKLSSIFGKKFVKWRERLVKSLNAARGRRRLLSYLTSSDMFSSETQAWWLKWFDRNSNSQIPTYRQVRSASNSKSISKRKRSTKPGLLESLGWRIDTHYRRSLGIESLESRSVLATQAFMINDAIPDPGINNSPANNSSNPSGMIEVGGTIYFRASDGNNGDELWRINSSGVAELVEDAVPGGGITPGGGHSNPQSLTNVSGTLYFLATDEINGIELWRINSSGIAEMVEDSIAGGGIRPGATGSNPSNFTNVSGTLYFRANDGINGYELWRINSSGIAEMVEDSVAGGGIRPGVNSSSPIFLTNIGGTLYFQATDGTNGYELWQINSNGIAEMVEDSIAGGGIRPGANGSYPTHFTNVSGTLYFRANDGINGDELWRINSSGIAEMVEDSVAGGGISPGVNSSSPIFLTNIGGTLYFQATDGTNGIELWRINSSGIAEMVEDSIAGGGINPGINCLASLASGNSIE